MAADGAKTGEVLDRLWRFEAVHPEWIEGDGWDPEVAWWALATAAGLVLIDPLVEDWQALDRLVEQAGGCAAIVRTCLWHERSIPQAHERYGADVWARTQAGHASPRHFDRIAEPGQPLPGGIEAIDVIRDDEIGLWLPEHEALLFGDVMLRDRDGTLTMCPESWVARAGGRARLRTVLSPLLERAPRHVLVSHGPLVLDDGPRSLARALAEPG